MIQDPLHRAVPVTPGRTAGSRWVAFNIVGAGGFIVQMAALRALVEGAGLHYAPGAAIALEAAILHNFLWHARWTWRDRPRADDGVLRRLARFNALHGATAALGLGVIVLLVEGVGAPYMLAALTSVAVCALLNFTASDRLVFAASMAAILLAFDARPAHAGPPATATQAFARLATAAEQRLDTQDRTGRAAWLEGLPQAAGDAMRRRLLRGDVVVHDPRPEIPGGAVPCGGALCHHWAASVFVPAATPADLEAVMQAYEAYDEIYAPAVRRSRLVARDGHRFTVQLQLATRKVVTVVLNTEYDVRYNTVSATRVRVDSRSTRVAEVAEPDTPREHEKDAGGDVGYLWRSNTYCMLDAGDGGTYVTCESLSLSRDVPAGLGWLVRPFVTAVPRESLEFTLQRLRAAHDPGTA